jgi:glutamate formiminotransferase
MPQIISAVPNVSEGRDVAFVEALQERLEAVPGLVVLDVSMDQVRNRTVFSFTGDRRAIFEGGFAIYERALERVDMRQHQGEYPRIGAVDVFPFVALRDAPLPTAVEWSVEFAEQVAARFAVPVYLFAESARTKLRRDVESIREGEYEGFAAKMTDPLWKPDFGPDVFPPDKGATIIGARLPLVNFKAYLTTGSERAAERVADVLSDPATGFTGVHFYPALDRTRNEALLNITVGNFHATPLYRILEAIKTELRRFGAGVSRVEMVGLVPERALIESAEHYLQVFDFTMDDVLENRLDAILRPED